MRRVLGDRVSDGGFHQGQPNWRCRAVAVLSFGLCAVALVQLLSYGQQVIIRSTVSGARQQERIQAAALELSPLASNDVTSVDGISHTNGTTEFAPQLVPNLPEKCCLLGQSTKVVPPRQSSTKRHLVRIASRRTTHASSPKIASSRLQTDQVCRNRSSELTSTELHRLSGLFAPVIVQSEKDALSDLLRLLDNTLRANDISYVVYAGTLLGAVRHRALIPWDDDADVFVNLSDAPRLQSALESLPDHRLYTRPRWRYKFYHANRSAAIDGRSWRWPFVDINFYGVNSTHLYDLDPELRDTWAWPPHVVLPAASLTFEGLVMPAPRDPTSFIDVIYNQTMCETRVWSHRKEVYAPRDRHVTEPCWKLHGLFVFYCSAGDNDGGDE